nr:MAG TPA: hypothetical protein [Caudoviricetes sp.]
MKDRPETCFYCMLYSPRTAYQVNTQIFSHAFRRCNKRILSPSCFPTHINPTCSRNRHEGDGIQSIQ